MDPIFNTIVKPTLLLDEAAVRRNIQRLAEHARRAGITFRPHFKTHQSAQIGEWFREEGVTAITTSSVDMALYFARHGWDDITIAFPANIRQKTELADLARDIRLGLLVESAEAVQQLAATLDAPAGVWIKIDTGAGRTGIAWDQPEQALALVKQIEGSSPLNLRGLLTHAGQTYLARGKDEVCRRYTESAARIDNLRRRLHSMGSAPLAVSVGDTPGTSLCADLGPVDEIRPGNFVFYDAQQLQIGSCGWEDVAVALACPVVALHPERCEAVIYGGAIHLSKDFMTEGEKRMYGMVCLPQEETRRWGAPLPGAYVSAVSQEHGVLRMQPVDLARLRVGDLVCILPAHSCLTVMLMKRYLTLDGKFIETMNVYDRRTTPESILFYYENEIEYGCFSNYAPYPIQLKGKTWLTNEHYFQAQKFVGTDHEEVIRQQTTPDDAKRKAHDKSRPLRNDWNAVKEDVMREALWAKFTQYPNLARRLLQTGDAILVEHTKNDSYWADGGDGSGRNRLGHLLMEVRDKLKQA